MKSFLCLLLGFLFIISACQPSDGTDQSETVQVIDPVYHAKINTYLMAHVTNRKFNGHMLIVKNDTTLFNQSYGSANRKADIPITENTKFLIGSITKPFVSMCILILVEQGQLSLDQSIEHFFPDFPRSDEVQLRMLLNHTSGIRDYHFFNSWQKDSKNPELSVQDVINSVSVDAYDFDPGTQFRYSNTGYILLGRIIEKVSGLSFETFLKNNITDVLSLENTGVIDNDKEIENLAIGYSSDPRESNLADYINYNQPFTSGNMYSTCHDLYLFTKAVMDHKLIGAELSKKMFEDNAGGRYGYGWGIRSIEKIYGYGHHGGMNGYYGSITYLLDEEHFICFLTNDDNTPFRDIYLAMLRMKDGAIIPNPPNIKLIPLNEEMITNAEGDYLVKPGDTLHIYRKNERLFLQETGQAEHELFPYRKDSYSFKLFGFNAVFSNIVDGKAQQLEFQGANLKAPRIKPSN